MLWPVAALPQALFYQGKTITVLSGQDPGGLGDLRLKAILPHLKRHIPGQPNIVPEYMPGGFDVVIKRLPGSPEDVDFYKKVAGAGPLPGH
jgi:hypothetical protein